MDYKKLSRIVDYSRTTGLPRLVDSEVISNVLLENPKFQDTLKYRSHREFPTENDALYKKWKHSSNAAKRVSCVYQALKSQGVLDKIKGGELNCTLDINTDDLIELLAWSCSKDDGSFSGSEFVLTVAYALDKIGFNVDFDAPADFDGSKLNFTVKKLEETSEDKLVRAYNALKKKFPEWVLGASGAEKYSRSVDWLRLKGPKESWPTELSQILVSNGVNAWAIDDKTPEVVYVTCDLPGWDNQGLISELV